MDKLAVNKKRNLRKKFRSKKGLLAKNGFRLCLNKSNKNFYAQIVDNEKGVTVLGVSTVAKDFSDLKVKGNIEAAKILGKTVATKALEKGIKEVVFDRNGALYHGKVKAFAEAAREGGLKF